MSDDLIRRANYAFGDTQGNVDVGKLALFADCITRIEELEAKLTTCEKYRDAYAECDRIGAQAVRQLEAKLAQGIMVEYDDGSRVSLSAHAGGASEGGAWSHLTLMKEERDGAVSFRRYTADGDWRSPIVSSATAELETKLAKVVAAGVRVRNYYENHGSNDVYAVSDFNAVIAELKGPNDE